MDGVPSPEALPWPGECEAVDDHSRIGQGDILRWERQIPPWEIFAVVVTADCDIALAKHAGILSYVPVLTLHDYWRLFTLPLRLDRYVSKTFLPAVFLRIKELQRRFSPTFEPLSDEAIHALLRTSEPEAALQAFGVPPTDQAVPLRFIRAYQSTLRMESGHTLHQWAGTIAELRVATTTNRSNPAKVLDELPGAITDLPGDAFFVSRLTSTDAEGYVAYLRLIRDVPSIAVAMLAKDLSRPGVKARRVARLSSPFLYRLTQQLGQVFADIGLPKHYEDQRTLVAQTVRAAVPAVMPEPR